MWEKGPSCLYSVETIVTNGYKCVSFEPTCSLVGRKLAVLFASEVLDAKHEILKKEKTRSKFSKLDNTWTFLSTRSQRVGGLNRLQTTILRSFSGLWEVISVNPSTVTYRQEGPLSLFRAKSPWIQRPPYLKNVTCIILVEFLDFSPHFHDRHHNSEISDDSMSKSNLFNCYANLRIDIHIVFHLIFFPFSFLRSHSFGFRVKSM